MSNAIGIGVPMVSVALGGGGASSAAFRFEAITTEASQAFHMPLLSTSTINATIDWGDGTTNTVTSYDDPNAIHTYNTADTYDVVVAGTVNGWSFGEYTAVGDNAAAPASLENIQIGSGLTLTVDDGTNTDFEVDITTANGGTPITLPAGNYWISFAPRVIGSSAGAGRWNWRGVDNSPAHESTLIDYDNLFGAGATDWTPLSGIVGSNNYSSLGGVLTDSLGNDLYNVTGTVGIISTNGADDGGVVCATYITITEEVTLGSFAVSGFMSVLNGTISSLLTGADFFIYEDVGLGVPVTPGTSIYSTLMGNVSEWGSFDISEPGVFSECVNMTVTATDTPSISGDSLTSAFKDCTALTTIPTIGDWDVSGILYMNSCFLGTSITNLSDVNNWGSDTANVVEAISMFSFSDITSLNLSSWDVSSLTNISDMFSFNTNLVSVDLSNWDSNVITNFISAFQQCTALTTVTGIETLITSNATAISTLFDECNSLAAIDASAWNTSNVVTATGAFKDCTSITSVDISGWDLSSMTDMSAMFSRCSMTTIDVSGWTNGGLIDMSDFVSQTSSLTTIDFSTSACTPTNISYMFSACTNLTSVDMTGWDVSNVTSTFGMFSNCTSLTTITGHEDFRLTGLTGQMSYMFRGCSSLVTLDVSEWAVTGVTSTAFMFYSCNALTSLDMSGWNVSTLTNMNYMFYSPSTMAITTLGDLSGWTTGTLTGITAMFTYCSNLASVDVSGWDTSGVTSFNGVFYNCRSMTTIDVTNWNSDNVTDMEYMFYNTDGGSSPIVGLNGWNTGNVTNFRRTFQNCKFRDLDISGWDTSSATNMNEMLYDCDSFDENIGSWDINQVTGFASFMTNSTGLSTANYDALLIGWAAQIPLAYNGTLNFGSAQYTLGGAAEAARTQLIADVGAISDGGGV